MADEGLHIRVSGGVQGVGYRFHCRHQADSLNVRGWVMNLEDGDVEMEAYGTHGAVFDFLGEVTRQDRGFLVEITRLVRKIGKII